MFVAAAIFLAFLPCILIVIDHAVFIVVVVVLRPHGLIFSWWGCHGLCLRHKPAELAHSFYSVLMSVSVFMAPFNCISFHKFSRQLSVFLLSSSGLISALLVLSAIYLFLKVSFKPVWLTAHKSPTD